MGILLNGNKPSKIIYNGAESSLYFNGSKIWPDDTPVGPQQYKFRIESTDNGLITCKYLKCNDVFPDEPYNYIDNYGEEPYYAYCMIQGRDGGIFGWGDKKSTWVECTFYFNGTLTTFKYTPMDSKPSGAPNNMGETKITLTNLTTNTVVLTSTFTPLFATTYTFNL